MSEIKIIHGDCLDVLKSMPDASVDSIVTDPPAGISFMNREWDQDKGGRQAWVAWMESVAVECLRVIKPGGHALVWALPRTSHWTGWAWESAGWKPRDKIVHLFGTGFPKSLDVSKAIDKAGGLSPVDQSRLLRERREKRGLDRAAVAMAVGCTEASVRDWEEGRARSVGAAIEFITPSEEYREKLADFLGYSADERRVSGVSAVRASDGTVIGLGHSGTLRSGEHTDAAKQWAGWGTALKPAAEDWWVFRKPMIGTVAANVLAHGTGGLNIDGCRIGLAPDEDIEKLNARSGGSRDFRESYVGGSTDGPLPAGCDLSKGRWPANVVLGCACDGETHDPDCAVALLDEQTGTLRAGRFSGAKAKGMGFHGACASEADGSLPSKTTGDPGGASRFFYTAKASRSERTHHGTVENKHPTVKSIALMRWLCRLVTQPGGIVLDPFTGSGSTGVGAILEGFSFTGIEREAEYVEIAKERFDTAVLVVKGGVKNPWEDATEENPVEEAPGISSIEDLFGFDE